MFNTRPTMTTVALAAAGLLLATAIHAQTPGQVAGPGQAGARAMGGRAGMGPAGGGRMSGFGAGPMRVQMARRLARQLKLTDDQKAQLKASRSAQRPDALALRERMQAARQQLRTAMQAEVLDEAAVKAAADGVSSVRAEQLVAIARARANILKVLTPEQQQQLKNFRARAARGPRR